MKSTIDLLIYNDVPKEYHNLMSNNEKSFDAVSINRADLDSADVVLFYAPLLEQQMDANLGKPEGQLWVLWATQDKESAYWINEPEFRLLFDLTIGVTPYDDIPTNNTDNLLNRLYVKAKELIQTNCELKHKAQQLGDIYFCSFADSRFVLSHERMMLQAEAMGVFKGIFIYDEHMLSDSFKADFASKLVLGARGFGYWVWKPYVILECLERMKVGDVLLYTDLGCHLNPRGIKRFFDYWQEVKYNKSGFMVSRLEPKHTERIWTKGDVLDYFGVRDNSEVIKSSQYQANVVFVRKNDTTVGIVKKWLSIYYENFALLDDTPSVSSNMEGFVEHRHDQSILSLILKIYGTSVIDITEVYSTDWNEFDCLYPISNRRDLKR